MKILSVYNICGISKIENIEYYKIALNSLLNQENVNHDIVISSCMSSPSTINELIRLFPNIKINHIVDKVPVNVSFNHTCNIFDDGTYDAFLYVDSGIIFPNTQILSNMVQRTKSGPYAMTCCVTDTDQGVSLDNIGNLYSGDGLISDGLGQCVSVGSSLNLHCQIFTREIKDFFGNIIPDIFAGYCTESVFTFICASIKKRWAVTKDIVKHVVGIDGQSSGFHPVVWINKTGRESYDHPFAIESYMDRIHSPTAKQLGLGFEECRHVLMHDKKQFDKDYFCINDKLKDYIKDNLYLNQKEFDYKKIKFETITVNNAITNLKSTEISDGHDLTKLAPKMSDNGWSVDYKISVIIPTRERIELLQQCLMSLLDNSYQEDRFFEIILLIDSDDTKTLQAAIEMQDKFDFTSKLDNTQCNSLSIMLLKRSEYMQRDYNNAGALAAKGDLVFILNDDAIINTKNWDQIIYDFYKMNKPNDNIMFIAIPDDSHDNESLDSLGNIRSQETHGSCFPIVTKHFVNLINGIFPSNIRMWGADIILFNIFKDIGKVYNLNEIKITHNSFHSKNRDKDAVNDHVEQISSKPHALISIASYIEYINRVIKKKYE